MLMKKMNEEKLKKKQTIVVEPEDSNASSEDSMLARMNQKAEVLRIKSQIKDIEVQNKIKEQEDLITAAGKRSMKLIDEKGPKRLKEVFSILENKNMTIDIPTLRDLNRQAEEEIVNHIVTYKDQMFKEKFGDHERTPQDTERSSKPGKRKESFEFPYGNRESPSKSSISFESRRTSALREILAFLLNDKLDEDTVGGHREPYAKRRFRIKKNTQKLLISELDKVIAKNKKLQPEDPIEKAPEEEEKSVNSDESSVSAKDNMLKDRFGKLKILNSYLEIIDKRYDKNLHEFRNKLQGWTVNINNQVDNILIKKLK